MEDWNSTHFQPILQAPTPASKQAYKKPVLTHYGELSSLTQGGPAPSAGEFQSTFYQSSG
jgi:hypothetical protein